MRAEEARRIADDAQLSYHVRRELLWIYEIIRTAAWTGSRIARVTLDTRSMPYKCDRDDTHRRVIETLQRDGYGVKWTEIDDGRWNICTRWD